MKLLPIHDHEGYYVSDTGHIYSQWVNMGRHGLKRTENMRILKGGTLRHSGHKIVKVGLVQKPMLVHRVVYETFKGIPEGLFVLHKDGEPSNNHIENLYAGTQEDNMRDRVRHKRCNFSKLNEDQVKEILSLKGTGTIQSIANKFKVDRRTVRSIFKGRTWKHITDRAGG